MVQSELAIFRLPQKTLTNLTRTQINLPSGQYVRSGKRTAFLKFDRELLEDVEGFATARLVNIEVVGLPEPQEGIWYIVSKSVFAHCVERTDLLTNALLRSCAEATNLVVIEAFTRR